MHRNQTYFLIAVVQYIIQFLRQHLHSCRLVFGVDFQRKQRLERKENDWGTRTTSAFVNNVHCRVQAIALEFGAQLERASDRPQWVVVVPVLALGRWHEFASSHEYRPPKECHIEQASHNWHHLYPTCVGFFAKKKNMKILLSNEKRWTPPPAEPRMPHINNKCRQSVSANVAVAHASESPPVDFESVSAGACPQPYNVMWCVLLITAGAKPIKWASCCAGDNGNVWQTNNVVVACGNGCRRAAGTRNDHCCSCSDAECGSKLDCRCEGDKNKFEIEGTWTMAMHIKLTTTSKPKRHVLELNMQLERRLEKKKYPRAVAFPHYVCQSIFFTIFFTLFSSIQVIRFFFCNIFFSRSFQMFSCFQMIV